jgi:hypothetical protein
MMSDGVKMVRQLLVTTGATSFCTFIALSAAVGPVWAQSDRAERPQAAPAAPAVRSQATPPAARKVSLERQQKLTAKAKNLYVARWGVDKLKVSSTSSGNLIRFSYRVTEPELAKVLGDRKATPYLFGQRSRALLQIPVMDKVGQLRQTGTPQAGQEYWMVFSNKGNLVRTGDRVNVMIGAFRADGLMVE